MSQLRIETAQGEFVVSLATNAAPKTTAYFAELARTGALDNSSVFRLVSADTNLHPAEHPIAVLQGGLTFDDPQPIPGVGHEGTNETLLQHRQWTVSTARFGPGETYGSFFVCMRDEPALDYGGLRHPDGLGFAAFGMVAAGHDVVHSIYAGCEADEMLRQPIGIHRVSLE